MAFASSGFPMQDSLEADPSARFLAAIETAHGHLEQCIVALEALMVEPELADLGQFSTVRFRLCQANLSRTQVAREACNHLIPMSPKGNTQSLRDLQQCEIEHFQMVSKHVQRWTSEAVQADWQGYCAATRKVLDRARELIGLETALLLPLLRQAGSQRSINP